jgi:hypothetical protein
LKRKLVKIDCAMVVAGIALLTGVVSNAGIWLPETFPVLQNFE